MLSNFTQINRYTIPTIAKYMTKRNQPLATYNTRLIKIPTRKLAVTLLSI